MEFKVQSKAFGAQKLNLLVMKFLQVDQKFYAELKKYIMGSEMQPGVMRAQKREKILYLV
jgi:hypothetical protein